MEKAIGMSISDTEVDESYRRLREDKKVWDDYKREVGEWDATLMNGLEED